MGILLIFVVFGYFWHSFLVSDVLSILFPSNALVFFLLLRKNIRFRSSVVEAASFLKVTNGKCVLLILFQVLHFEVVPLNVPPCVAINPQEQLVLS